MRSPHKINSASFAGLAGAGFGGELLPITDPAGSIAPSSNLQRGSMGKAPGRLTASGWTGLKGWRDAPPATAPELAAWDGFRAKGGGIGLRSERFPGIDIDVGDQAFADQLTALVHATLGMSPRRIGRPPRRLHPFRLRHGAAPFAKREISFTLPGGGPFKVEVLAQGQQYVLHGVHASTGLPYQWPDGDLASLGAAALPEIDAADRDRFLDDVEAAVIAAGGAIVGAVSAGSAIDHNPADELLAPGQLLDRKVLIRSALAAIPNDPITGRDHNGYVGILAAVRAAAGPDLADDPDIVADVVSWADQWKVDSIVHEAKYRRDVRPPFRAGWPKLRAEALKAGWNDRFETTVRLHEATRAFAQDPLPPANDNPGGEWLSPADFEGLEPVPRRWVLPDWLPRGEATALFGRGGVGKSLLALQLAACVATGRNFLGVPIPEPGSVVVLSAEDDANELHRRQVAINRALGLELRDLKAITWVPRSGQENDLVLTGRDGTTRTTPLYARLAARVRETRACLLILDNVAQLFGGDENARREVTAFANRLTRLAQENDCAVLLLGHPAKASDSEFSGSSAWDAAVRSRWLFARPEEDEDAPGLMDDVRVLERVKANYSKAGVGIAARYVAGAFVLESAAAGGPVAVAAMRRRHDEAFLAALDEITSRGDYASKAQEAKGKYAPKALALMPSIKAAGMTRKDIEITLHRLWAGGHVVNGDVLGTDRHKRRGLVRGEPLPALPAGAASDAASGAATPCGECGDYCAATCGRTLPIPYGYGEGASGAPSALGSEGFERERAAERLTDIGDVAKALGGS